MPKKLVKLLLLVLLLLIPRINSTSSYFIDNLSTSDILIKTGCWTKPDAPLLSLPSDSQLINHFDINFDWQPSVSPCKSENISYQIQIASDSLFSSVIYTSNWLTNTSFTHQFLSDGIYFWRVIARDSQNTLSEPSLVRSLSIDTQKPESVITYPWNSDHDNDIKYTYLWDGQVKGTAKDNNSGIDHIDITIQRMILDIYWNGSQWVKDPTAKISVGVSGPENNWEYKFLNRPPVGIFKIVSHAVDKAGNIENTATIIFENSDILPMSSNLTVDRLAHTLTFDIANITTLPLDYEITYQNQSGLQGFAGTITGSSYSKTFYLGTCSESVCIPDSIQIGSTITVLLGEETTSYLY